MIKIALFILCFVLLTATTFNLNVSIAPGLGLKNAILYLIFIMILAETALARNRRFELIAVLLPYFTFVVYGVATWLLVLTLFNYPRYELMPTLISLKGGLVDPFIFFLVFFYGVISKEDAIWLCKKLLWMILIVNLIAVIDALDIPNLGLFVEDKDGRVLGPMDQHNQYGAFCAVFIPAMVALWWGEKGGKKVLVAIGTFATILALFMTASRGAMAGLLFGLILSMVYLRKYISLNAILITSGASIILAITILGVLFISGYGNLIEERIIGQSGGTAFAVTSGRTYIWGTALSRMMDNPLTFISGFGWRVYEFSGRFHYGTHSYYINVLFNLGFIGLTLFIITIANALASARRALASAEGETFRYLLAFVPGILAFMVSIAFSEPTTAWIYVWAYTGLMMRVALMSDVPDASTPHDKVPSKIKISLERAE